MSSDPMTSFARILNPMSSDPMWSLLKYIHTRTHTQLKIRKAVAKVSELWGIWKEVQLSKRRGYRLSGHFLQAACPISGPETRHWEDCDFALEVPQVWRSTVAVGHIVTATQNTGWLIDLMRLFSTANASIELFFFFFFSVLEYYVEMKKGF